MVPATQSAGSWRTAGGTGAAAQVTVVRRQTGGYRVTFPGIAVAAGRGVAIVTALDPAAAVVETTGPVVSCHVVRWGAAGRDEQVDLTCRDAAGTPADSGFTALFSHVPDTASPGPSASAGGGRTPTSGPTPRRPPRPARRTPTASAGRARSRSTGSVPGITRST